MHCARFALFFLNSVLEMFKNCSNHDSNRRRNTLSSFESHHTQTRAAVARSVWIDYCASITSMRTIVLRLFDLWMARSMAPLYDGHDYYKRMFELQEKLRKRQVHSFHTGIIARTRDYRGTMIVDNVANFLARRKGYDWRSDSMCSYENLVTGEWVYVRKSENLNFPICRVGRFM